METKQVSTFQMATLMFSFMTGSAIIYIPSPVYQLAQGSAIISLMVASIFGMAVLACVLAIYKQHPQFTFIELIRKLLGKWLSLIIALPFVLLLALMVAFIIYDIGNFFNAAMMPETPRYVFNGLILLAAALSAAAGIEVLARMFTLLIFFMLLFFAVTLVMSIPNYHMEYLLPLFPEGIKPMLGGAYYLIGFPYGEIAVFSMLLPAMKKSRFTSVCKWMYGAIGLNTITLGLAIVCTIFALGPVAAKMNMPLYILAQNISQFRIPERIESIIGITLVVGSYVKATIGLYTLNLAISQTFRLKESRGLIYLVAIGVGLMSVTEVTNSRELSQFLYVEWSFLWLVFMVTPVVLLALIVWMRRRWLSH